MRRRERQRRLLATAAALVVAGGWLAAHRLGETAALPTGGAADVVRVVRGGASFPTVPRAPHATMPPDATEGDAPLAARIAQAADLRAADWRSVHPVDAGRAACGEVARTRGGAYHRFVWIDVPGLLAVDDGGLDFARLARVCAGTSLDQLAAAAS